MEQIELSDFDIDRQLLTMPGVSLVIFTGAGCSVCRWAHQALPAMSLPIDRLCWVDAEGNGGSVQRYGVFHLPALFVVRDGQFHGALHCRLSSDQLIRHLSQLLGLEPEELP